MLREKAPQPPPKHKSAEKGVGQWYDSLKRGWLQHSCVCNDPSAGSPTETLLRLLLPLNDKV